MPLGIFILSCQFWRETDTLWRMKRTFSNKIPLPAPTSPHLIVYMNAWWLLLMQKRKWKKGAVLYAFEPCIGMPRTVPLAFHCLFIPDITNTSLYVQLRTTVMHLMKKTWVHKTFSAIIIRQYYPSWSWGELLRAAFFSAIGWGDGYIIYTSLALALFTCHSQCTYSPHIQVYK